MSRVISPMAGFSNAEKQSRLEEALLLLGPRHLVLLEGPTDVGIFENWYDHRADLLLFFDAGGSESVEAFLANALTVTRQGRVYAILDRDYRDDGEVDAWRSEPKPRRFFLKRHELENYLLEPSAIESRLRVIFRGHRQAPTRDEIEQELMSLCQARLETTAANRVLRQGNPTAELFGAVLALPVLVRQCAVRLGIGEPEVASLLAEQEAGLQGDLQTLEIAHTRIEGKWLFEQVYKHYYLRGISQQAWRNLLAEEIGKQGVHEDIQIIIEHILGEPVLGT